MIGLLNDARLRAGQPPMGFPNPWLYGEARGSLTDVMGGFSRGCDGYDSQTGMMVPGAGVVGERGAFWNATAGESRIPASAYLTADGYWWANWGSVANRGWVRVGSGDGTGASEL